MYDTRLAKSRSALDCLFTFMTETLEGIDKYCIVPVRKLFYFRHCSGFQPRTRWGPFVAAIMLGHHEPTKDRVEPTAVSITVLNMVRFPVPDPTGFCNSEPDADRTGFRKNLYPIRYGYPKCVDRCSKMFNQSFFRIETGLDQILGLCYRIRIGLDYTKKMLDWIRIANVQHYNIIAVRLPVRLGSLYKFNVIFGVISSEPAFRLITVTGI